MKPRRKIAVVITLLLAMSGAAAALGASTASATDGTIIVQN